MPKGRVTRLNKSWHVLLSGQAGNVTACGIPGKPHKQYVDSIDVTCTACRASLGDSRAASRAVACLLGVTHAVFFVAEVKKMSVDVLLVGQSTYLRCRLLRVPREAVESGHADCLACLGLPGQAE